MRRTSMVVKMVALFIAMILTTAMVIGYFSFLQFSDSKLKEANDRNIELARNNGFWITDLIDRSMRDIEFLSKDPDLHDDIRNWNETDIIETFKSFTKTQKTYHFIEVLELEDQAPETKYKIKFRYPDRNAEDQYESFPPFKYFLKDVHENMTTSINFVILPQTISPDTNTGVPTIILSAPVISNGTVIAILNGALSLEVIDQMIKNVKVGDDGYLFLVDDQGRLISHPNRESITDEGTFSELDIVKRVIQGDNGTVTYKNDVSGQREMGAYVTLEELGWGVIAVIPEDEVRAPLDQLWWALLQFMIIFCVAGAVFGYLFIKRITVPLSELTKSTRIVIDDMTDPNKRLKKYDKYEIPVRSNDEIGDLALSFNQMTRELVESHRGLEKKIGSRTAKLRQTNKDLSEANRKLKEADRLKSEFLANMSHELRTPLNAIIGFSEVLSNRSFGDLTPQQEEFIKDIHSAGKHLLQLINEILDLSKIEAGKMQLNLQVLGLEDMIREVQDIVKPLYTKKGLSFSVDIPTDLPTINADALRLKQVLYNLMSNAIKFTPSYGLVRITAQTVGNYVRVDVIDTGIGIQKEDYDKIFKEFTQIDMSASREHEGTGLGLPLSKRLVELHGGRIWFKSVVGAGSTFSFTIPAFEGDPGAAPAPSAPLQRTIDPLTAMAVAPRIREPEPPPEPVQVKVPEPAAPATRSGKKLILVIDDSEDARNLLSSLLIDEGYEVVTARNGESGLRRAVDLVPFAIILDVLLPDISGWEVMRKLKEMSATEKIPIIIVSVLEDASKGISMGAIDHFVKPVDRHMLLTRLKEMGVRPKGDGGPMRILVIDDQPQAVKLISAILSGEGYEILKAFGGIQGLEVARSDKPDLIILDLVMPDLSGIEVLRDLKKDRSTRDIPVIILTAKTLTKKEEGELREHVLTIARKESFSRERLLKELGKISG